MIVVHELVKRFSSAGRDVLAVDQLSFTVAPAEVFGLLGPNGAGKTTTLRMIVGLLQPDAGFAEIGGYRSSDQPEQVKSRVGLVSASAGTYPWLSVREMLLFFAELYGVPEEEAVANLAHLVDVLDMASFVDRRCLNLSTGQSQRVTLARALIHDPPVMLLDEPTRGLDVLGSQVIFDYITHLREQGKAIILSTHRLDEAQRICDRFGLLHEGQFVQQGSLEQLRAATGCSDLVDMFLGIVRQTKDLGADDGPEDPVSWADAGETE